MTTVFLALIAGVAVYFLLKSIGREMEAKRARRLWLGQLLEVYTCTACGRVSRAGSWCEHCTAHRDMSALFHEVTREEYRRDREP